jgi:protein-S-isoprenylcysteine O-methyltransferase Ste14
MAGRGELVLSLSLHNRNEKKIRKGDEMNIFRTVFEIVNFSVLSAFLLSEILINVFKRGDKSRSNIRSGKISNAMIMTVGLSSIVLGTTIGFLSKFMDIRWLFSPDYYISSLGLLLIIIGVVVRWSAVLTLSKYFTVDVTIMDDHRLIRSGVFKYLRHPSYFGLLIAVLGLGVTMVNWLSIIIMLVPHCVIIILRINEEERALEGRFGSDYEDYRRNTKRLIPFIY